MEVWSIMVWLKHPREVAESEPTSSSVEERRSRQDRPEGYRTAVFNPPSLSRVQYADYESREDAEEALKDLAEDLAKGKPLFVPSRDDAAFVIPAHSVHYLALGRGKASERLTTELESENG